MSEVTDIPETEAPAAPEYLVGVRVREPLLTDDYLTGDGTLAVGDLCLVESGEGTAVGEVRRPKRPLPEFRRDRAYRRVIRRATDWEVREWRNRRQRELEAAERCRVLVRSRGLQMKIVDVAIEPSGRRYTVFFGVDERVDFRDLVRELAREFRVRIEMRQVGARDTTKVMDGIGPCGRQLCCSSHLRKFEPISVKMAKSQDMPLTDNRLLGNCGRLKCCLLYEFSTYEELRKFLPKVGSACTQQCGGGCMAGKVKSVRVLKQSVVVGFPDGTEAEVPVAELSWEGRPHVKPIPEAGSPE
jgi:cell fate regulator YaaT (PSP1 superfamily)